MRLSKLCDQAGVACPDNGASDASVTGFAIDNRKVAPGTVFGAFQGTQASGEDFIPAAVEAGAVAVVARPEARIEDAVHIADNAPRKCFATLAAQFFGPFPEHVVAITGTNGKTSCVEMTRQLWRMAGERAASIGTLGVTTPDESVSTGLTTPDIVTFLSNMSGLSREGVTHVAFEASSHGLSQYRNEGVPVMAAGFTNFSRDHLDYHADMEDYFAAKMRLFDEVVSDSGTVVVWIGSDESEWNRRVVERASARGLKVMTVGEKGEDIRLKSREATQLGQSLTVEHDGVERTITLPLIGAYQVSNALVSAGLALATGIDAAQVWDGVARLQPVRGRLERAVIAPSGAPIYVDYAHTPDALEAAIAALRPHVTGRLITVFGAGGDRDHGKRAPMGEAAARASDLVIVTDDNPRGEDAATIRAAIMEGVPGARDIAGRREAIQAAIGEAARDDIVLIAGKGHETGQIIGAGENMRVHPFDDVEVARECAAQLTGSGAGERA